MRSISPAQDLRVDIDVRFSFQFEQKLASQINELERSLVADFEGAVRLGLDILTSLEDADDLQSTGLADYVNLASTYMTLASGKLLPAWLLPINRDLVDEVDLIILMHGEELQQLNLKEVTRGSVLLMLALAGLDRAI